MRGLGRKNSGKGGDYGKCFAGWRGHWGVPVVALLDAQGSVTWEGRVCPEQLVERVEFFLTTIQLNKSSGPKFRKNPAKNLPKEVREVDFITCVI